MFENLRRAFREAVDNFNRELNRDQVPETVDRLLAGMRREVTDAEVRIRELRDDLRKAEAEAKHEAEEEATCRRREAMARKIDDQETADIAATYAARHEERKQVLDAKVAALTEEVRVRRAEIQDMVQKFEEATRNRDALAASAGRTSARESIRGGDDLFDELDRMADKIGDDEALGEAAQELSEDLGSGEDFDRSRSTTPDVDSRLRELKRRMNQD